MSALMLAAYYDHPQSARFLLSQKAGINKQDGHGTTALMWAAYAGDLEMTLLLLQAGADAGAKRVDGDTALLIARRWEHEDVISALSNVEPAAVAKSGDTRKAIKRQPVRRAKVQVAKPAEKKKPLARRIQKGRRRAPSSANTYSATED
jgi:ankyrin repeat protein